MFRSLIVFALVLTFGHVSTTQAEGIEAPKQVDDKLWVMGVPDQKDLQHFAEHQGQIVISLLSEDEVHDMTDLHWYSQQNLAFYNIPVDGSKGVTFANARLLDKLLLQHSEKNILVHCSSANRVGALFALRAAWLDGKSTSDALALGRRHGLTDLEEHVTEMLAQ
ncbi:serine/threonine protein phosphatase [Idiomarina seosinensis]|uniref:serine/threonine protein phosphatase n=1 Tax=Idiomarina seosinensis TaxID=281739 RepID=UPI00384C63D8